MEWGRWEPSNMAAIHQDELFRQDWSRWDSLQTTTTVEKWRKVYGWHYIQLHRKLSGVWVEIRTCVFVCVYVWECKYHFLSTTSLVKRNLKYSTTFTNHIHISNWKRYTSFYINRVIELKKMLELFMLKPEKLLNTPRFFGDRYEPIYSIC